MVVVAVPAAATVVQCVAFVALGKIATVAFVVFGRIAIVAVGWIAIVAIGTVAIVEFAGRIESAEEKWRRSR